MSHSAVVRVQKRNARAVPPWVSKVQDSEASVSDVLSQIHETLQYKSISSIIISQFEPVYGLAPSNVISDPCVLYADAKRLEIVSEKFSFVCDKPIVDIQHLYFEQIETNLYAISMQDSLDLFTHYVMTIEV